MVLFLAFMLLDVFTAVIIVLGQIGLVDKVMLFYHASYLLIKGGWFWKDVFSWIDIAIGLYVLLMIFGLRSVFSYVAAIYLIWKFASFMILR